MAFSLNSNIASLSVQRKLNTADNSVSKILEQLSSGQRINKASDDAAGLAISDKLGIRSKIYDQGLRNVNDAISVMQVADDTLTSLSSIVSRQKELAQQSANGALNSSQRSALQQENKALQDEYNRILNSAKFNGQSLFTAGQGQLNVAAGDSALDLDYLKPQSGIAGTGTYTSQGFGFGLIDGASASGGLLVYDINGDGLDDIFAIYASAEVGNPNVVLTVETYMGEADGTYSLNSSNFNTYIGNAFEAFDEVRAEYDGIGSLTISVAWSDTVLGDILWENKATIDPGPGTVDVLADSIGSPVSNQLGTALTGDFNGDGVLDLVSLNGDSSGFTINTQNSSPANFVNLTQTGMSISTASNAQQTLTNLSALEEDIQSSRSSVGASLSRLGSAMENLRSQATEAAMSRDRIRSVDVAEATASLSKNQILKRGATAMLAQANQQPLIVLELLGAGA